MTLFLRCFIPPLLGLLVAGTAACHAPSSKYRRASDRIADQLARQVEKRIDLRQVRLLVYSFEPCASPAQATYSPHWGGHTEHELTGQIKHQLITALARRFVVVEGDALLRTEATTTGRRDAGAEVHSPYPQAELLGATTVLVGNYVIERGDDVIVMARLVDATSNEILATAEETIRRVDLPPRTPPAASARASGR